jgi:hypothetical protein
MATADKLSSDPGTDAEGMFFSQVLQNEIG